MNKVAIVVAAFALVLGGAALALGGGKTVVERVTEVGANPGPEATQHQFFLSGSTEGGKVVATSTSGTTVPLTASDLTDTSTIDVTLNVQDATLSFPASSTLTGIIPKAGMTRTIKVRNATTTLAMDLTVTGGTGVLLKRASSSSVIVGDTDGSNYGEITLTRKANSDIAAFLRILVD